MTTLIKKPRLFLWALLFVATAFTFISAGTSIGNESNQASYKIDSLNWEQTADEYILVVKGTAPPTYTMYELFNPYRVIVDIADATINPAVDMTKNMPQGPITHIKGQILDDQEPSIARIEIFLSEENSFTIARQGDDIFVKFSKPHSDQQPQAPQIETSEELQVAAEITVPSSEAMVVDVVTEVEPEQIPGERIQQSIQVEVPAPIVPSVDAAEKIYIEPQEIDSKEATLLLDIEVEHTPSETKVYLRANGVINNYEKVHLTKNTKANRPDRMYIDVKNVRLAGPIPPKEINTALAQIRTGPRTNGFRTVFDSSLEELFDYDITEQPDGLLITIREPSAATAVIAELLQEESVAQDEPVQSPEPEIFMAGIEEEPVSDATEPPEPDLSIKEPVEKKETTISAVESDLAFAGYTKQRITVDFYKIDLHNVFRLFGEISNVNMVVDEAVGGSLTLSLNDVPWDFAMEIILNLKDLQKEERFNTIVISPKSKNFEWPKRSLSNIEFKAEAGFDVKEQQEEAIKISRRQEVPETVVRAKNLLHQAQESEKIGNYTLALNFYEDAFEKWPENTIIAKRIAALCLINLGQNAKSVHYAKTALRANPSDYDSALQAAIGLARMKKVDEAKKYFEKSISGPKPGSASLVSYAAFSEDLQDFDLALTLLKQHEDFHGDSLETMISTARIHDKQGNTELANLGYRTIMLSGYEIPADLARYIKGRASLATP